MNWKLTRRDMCFVIGRRGQKLDPIRAAEAWWVLSRHLERLGEEDVPKFRHLITGIRAAQEVAALKVRAANGDIQAIKQWQAHKDRATSSPEEGSGHCP